MRYGAAGVLRGGAGKVVAVCWQAAPAPLSTDAYLRTRLACGGAVALGGRGWNRGGGRGPLIDCTVKLGRSPSERRDRGGSAKVVRERIVKTASECSWIGGEDRRK